MYYDTISIRCSVHELFRVKGWPTPKQGLQAESVRTDAERFCTESIRKDQEWHIGCRRERGMRELAGMK